MALSTDPASDDISELGTVEKFAELTEAQKLKLLSSTDQEISVIYFNNGREDYKANNLETPITNPDAGVDERADWGIASVAGTLNTFSSPLADALYGLVLPVGVSYIHPVTLVDSRTAAGFTAYANEDDVEFFYLAKEAQ